MPPHKPRGEPLKVTIGNQEKQIQLLIERVMTLEQERDAERRVAHQTSADADLLREQLISQRETSTRLIGWQDCARECLELKLHGVSIDPMFREVS